LPYDPIKDFTPISEVASYMLVLVVHPSVPVATLREFVDFARSQPNGLTVANAGSGTPTHLAACCSPKPPTSIWCTFPTVPPRQQPTFCLLAMSSRCSTTPSMPCHRLRPTACVGWRLPDRSACRYCPSCRPLPSLAILASRPGPGLDYLVRRTCYQNT